MDLREAGGGGTARHPWELARLAALRRILKGTLRDGLRVLDIGCGDGFVARGLFEGTGMAVVAVDSNFTPADLARLSGASPNMRFCRALEGPGVFDLVLLLDVVEHVDDDAGLLAGLVEKRLSKGGRVLMTVPAFNSLFSGHDTFLGHMRRYNLGELRALAQKAGLGVKSSGYLFSSLLLPKTATVLYEKSFGSSPERAKGVGSWRGGALLTAVVTAALEFDNAFSLALNRLLGLRLPGLTGWVLCEKQR